ncbi:hypothetical protein L486_07821 [Kwoniella mangroviensis CBS 10435]|uniref:F-box domain-containing protein n=1 Tax=Kwoniella mangroviensis CBS 10435 TaxID=1331196 RepID=A0A1B9IGZ6_9TREE|nr:uncharacterized protein I203_07125 [Kwoniella mangroviensis CBS 8507]OCF54687.1 hypothetical protein L486_07821 [Kwoniella mangroviensis CBS 10435]OCF63804.1 hypothetical protein I203_07125 [Kwoniella mangroviensis CBS 8507]OCF78685.1 hypothetical protein I204_00627 [Kwoniella mangroviensis CBS 8886]
MDEATLHDLDAELRAIRLDDGPRLQPLRLDKMFLRARQWHAANPRSYASESLYRPPTPPKSAPIYPLPKPLLSQSKPQAKGKEREGKEEGVSPLSALFDYPELIPLVLDSFDQPRDLARISRVSKEWNRIARKKLYKHIWVRPWEDGCHFKLVLLFDTLHKHPELCRMVNRLDVRFFPLAARGEERSEMDDQVQKAMGEMDNLESLVWTRDRSINPSLFERIADLSHLRSLEISGHSYRYYDPTLLGTMPALEDLRIMMPDPNLKSKLVDVVRSLAARPIGGLRGLGIICQSSSLIDDAILKTIASDLNKLKRLTLWGCTRVTTDGVFSILQTAGDEVEELSLDALTHSGLMDLSNSPSLPRLRTLSLSITVPHQDHKEMGHTISFFELPILPSCPSLESLHFTLSASQLFLPLGAYQQFHEQIQHPEKIRKLSLINSVIATDTFEFILEEYKSLEELYISVNSKTTIIDSQGLIENGQGLEILHVNGPERWGPNSDDLKVIAERLKGLQQVGSGNRVYEVHRTLTEEIDGNGNFVEDTQLSRWSKSWIPGYFQVWRA